MSWKSLVTTSGQMLSISRRFCTGPSTWSNRLCARPSQNCLKLKAALNTVGAFTNPVRPSMPVDTTSPSSPPALRSWQVAQEMVSFLDNLGSWNSRLPSSALASFTSIMIGTGLIGSAASSVFRRYEAECQAEAEHPQQAGGRPVRLKCLLPGIHLHFLNSATVVYCVSRLSLSLFLSSCGSSVLSLSTQ